MRLPSFDGGLAQEMDSFVMFKRTEGFDYTSQATSLHYFDAFCCQQGHEQANLSRQTVEAYVAHIAQLAPNTRYDRLSIVRVFSRYLHQLDPASYVLHELPVKRPALPRWYLYSPDEIATLLADAKTLRPAGTLRPHCFYMLLGLLHVTGLRISEALALNLGDLDANRGVLLVRKGKFAKQRYVVLDQSTVQAANEYLSRRIACQPSTTNAPFFLTNRGERLNYWSAAGTFRRMVRRLGIGHGAQHLPRLHDMRHSYASNCLLKWHSQGADVNAKLPILATAMGHVNVAATQVYLHVTPRLREQATQRFHGRFAANCKAA